MRDWGVPTICDNGKYLSRAKNPTYKNRERRITFNMPAWDNPIDPYKGDLILLYSWIRQCDRQLEMLHRISVMAVEDIDLVALSESACGSRYAYRVRDKYNYKKIRLENSREYIFN